MAKHFIGRQTTSKPTLSVRIWSKDLFSAVNNEIRRKLTYDVQTSVGIII